MRTAILDAMLALPGIAARYLPSCVDLHERDGPHSRGCEALHMDGVIGFGSDVEPDERQVALYGPLLYVGGLYLAGSAWLIQRYPHLHDRSPGVTREDLSSLFTTTLLRDRWLSKDGLAPSPARVPEWSHLRMDLWALEPAAQNGVAKDRRRIEIGTRNASLPCWRFDFWQDDDGLDGEVRIRFSHNIGDEEMARAAISALHAIQKEYGLPTGKAKQSRRPIWEKRFQRYLDWWAWRCMREGTGIDASDKQFCARPPEDLPPCWDTRWAKQEGKTIDMQKALDDARRVYGAVESGEFSPPSI